MYVALNLIMAIIASVASTTNIAVIRRMKPSGYLLLLLTMSVFQLMYDLTVFFSNVDVNYWVTTVANVFQIVGGIGESLTSNFIALVVLYIVKKRKSCDIYASYNYMLSFCLIVSATNTIFYLYAQIPENAHPDQSSMALLFMYYYIRLGSIFLNFIIFGVSAYLIQRIRSKGTSRSEAEAAITTLSRRLIYYPIVQVTNCARRSISFTPVIF